MRQSRQNPHGQSLRGCYSRMLVFISPSGCLRPDRHGVLHSFDGSAAFPQLISHVVDGAKGTNLEADGHLERAVGPQVGFVCHGVQEPFLTEQ